MHTGIVGASAGSIIAAITRGPSSHLHTTCVRFTCVAVYLFPHSGQMPGLGRPVRSYLHVPHRSRAIREYAARGRTTTRVIMVESVRRRIIGSLRESTDRRISRCNAHPGAFLRCRTPCHPNDLTPFPHFPPIQSTTCRIPHPPPAPPLLPPRPMLPFTSTPRPSPASPPSSSAPN